MVELSQVDSGRPLSKRESQALTLHDKSGAPNVSPHTAAQMFALYLNGKTAEDIQRLNPGFSLGAIVRAKVDGKWDERLMEYQSSLLDNVSVRAKQTVLESVSFVADLLSATHKVHGARIARYLQTGDPDELGPDLEVKSIASYKTALEMFLRLTGQDRDSKVQHSHNIVVDTTPPNAASGEQASAILAILADKDKDTKK